MPNIDNLPKWKESVAATHIQGAVLFARQAGRIERSTLEEFEQTFHDGLSRHIQHRAYVINSLISSISYTEAVVNELYDQHMNIVQNGKLEAISEDDHVVSDSHFYSNLRRLDQIEQEDFMKKPLLKKYQAILIYADEEPFDEGARPYQDIFIIKWVRNYFVHYEPEWYEPSGRKKHIEHEIGSALQGQFELNPLTDESDPYFPHRCLSFGFAKWAIERSKEFVDTIYERLDIDPVPTPAIKEPVFEL